MRVPFAQYMHEALYGPVGYYHTDVTRFGRSGDFFTSAQVSPIFGELWASFVLSHGPARVVEVGCGDGHLAEGLVSGLLATTSPDEPVLYGGIEVSRTARDRAAARLMRLRENLGPADRVRLQMWFGPGASDLVAQSGGALCGASVIGNEVLDALPCEVVALTGSAVQRLWVVARSELDALVARCGWEVGPFVGEQLATGFAPSDDARCVQFAREYLAPAAREWEIARVVGEFAPELPAVLADWTKCLAPRAIAFADYGGGTVDVVGPDRPHGSVRAYKAHRLVDDFIDHAGLCDVTCDVNLDMVAATLAALGYDVSPMRHQGAFLTELPGFERVLARASDPALARAIGQLVLPGALGDRFVVLTATRNGHATDETAVALGRV
ncbi:MAG: SAM-dependent methyltransferase [Firmicutes bacterium]|nr:SAM-dependent methyltransferase [Bacillota bacterium]